VGNEEEINRSCGTSFKEWSGETQDRKKIEKDKIKKVKFTKANKQNYRPFFFI
jgi:hypothetical protein